MLPRARGSREQPMASGVALRGAARHFLPAKQGENAMTYVAGSPQLSRIARAPRLALAAGCVVLLAALAAPAQLAPNRTNAFGNNRLVTFTYLQNFDCVDQPLLDLDFNHIPAQ